MISNNDTEEIVIDTDKSLVSPSGIMPNKVRGSCTGCEAPIEIEMPYAEIAKYNAIYTDGSTKLGLDGRVYAGYGVVGPKMGIHIAR